MGIGVGVGDAVGVGNGVGVGGSRKGVGVGGKVIGVGVGGNLTGVGVGGKVTGAGVGGRVMGVAVGSGVGKTTVVGVGCAAMAVRRAASMVGWRLGLPPQAAKVRQTTEKSARLNSFRIESSLGR